MYVIVAGGHGQIALRLERLLTGAGHTTLGIIRNPDHSHDVHETGATPVVCDLESTTAEHLAGHLEGADAVVFAAGAGPGSGTARKDTMDRDGSVLLADAAETAGISRFVQISAIGADVDPPPGIDEAFAAYLRAKAAAEEDLRRRDLAWTILRPGRLTNELGRGRVRLGPPPITGGEIPRDDVAAVLAALLTTGRGHQQTLVLVDGDTPIDTALHSLGSTN